MVTLFKNKSLLSGKYKALTEPLTHKLIVQIYLLLFLNKLLCLQQWVSLYSVLNQRMEAVPVHLGQGRWKNTNNTCCSYSDFHA